jgi:hypothetical protein
MHRLEIYWSGDDDRSRASMVKRVLASLPRGGLPRIPDSQSREFDAVFTAAIAAGRRVRHETSPGRHPASVGRGGCRPRHTRNLRKSLGALREHAVRQSWQGIPLIRIDLEWEREQSVQAIDNTLP